MKEIKIVAFSDIHGYLPDNLPSGDIALIAGDICPVHGSHNPTSQFHWLQNKFIPWCYKLINSKKFNHLCFCSGNHDFVFETLLKAPKTFHIQWPNNVHYLCDSGIDIEGIKIFGTPWTHTFGNWAFMNSEDILNNYYISIPKDLDILLSHGPAYGLNDTVTQHSEWVFSDPHIGSKSLLEHIKRAMPKRLITGHIHSANHNVEKLYPNPMEDKFIECVNVSLVDETYKEIYPPYQFSIIKE